MTENKFSAMIKIRRCLMQCSAKQIVLAVGVILGFRILLAALMPTSVTTPESSIDDANQLTRVRSEMLESGFQQDDVGTEKHEKGLEYNAEQFYLDGKPIRIIGGSFHYFRTRPEQWEDRLERMKAAGLNTITTYVAWNVHERQHSVYDFSADGYDLVDFIQVIQKMGMFMILRPGPYICAEWEFGGFPSWLLHDPNMKLRTSSYKPYMTHVERFLSHLLAKVKQYTFRRGGPIIAFQVENEFGSYETSPDEAYLQFLVDLHKKNGIKELLLTSDGSRNLAKGSLPNLLPTVNFNRNSAEHLTRLRKYSKQKRPLMVTEFWPGWFDHWKENHHDMKVGTFINEVSAVFSFNASINFYMFTGGTNFGFWNGANNQSQYSPTITSYDYDALISECGDIHPTKYQAFRELLVKYGLVLESALLPIPENPRKVAYGTVKLEQTMTLDVLCEVEATKVVTLPEPVFMEFLNVNDNSGQGYGWILYRAVFQGTSVNLKGILHDRAHIFINGKHADTIDDDSRGEVNRSLSFKESGLDSETLEILVENMGRVNYRLLDNQRKGFLGEVFVNGRKISKWQHFSLEFSNASVQNLQSSNRWLPSFDSSAQKRPTLYRGFLHIDDKTADTFLDMREWTKGIVIVNGFVIGRYWNVGPQQTLYVPWPLLKIGRNEVIVFELEKQGLNLIFVDKPVLDSRKSK